MFSGSGRRRSAWPRGKFIYSYWYKRNRCRFSHENTLFDSNLDPLHALTLQIFPSDLWIILYKLSERSSSMLFQGTQRSWTDDLPVCKQSGNLLLWGSKSGCARTLRKASQWGNPGSRVWVTHVGRPRREFYPVYMFRICMFISHVYQQSCGQKNLGIIPRGLHGSSRSP